MTGFNLPPGCEVHHIPGHRPEDERHEKLAEAFDRDLGDLVKDYIERGLDVETIKEICAE